MKNILLIITLLVISSISWGQSLNGHVTDTATSEVSRVEHQREHFVTLSDNLYMGMDNCSKVADILPTVK